MVIVPVLLSSLLFTIPLAVYGEASVPDAPTISWENGPETDPSYFPLGVWLQDPRHAASYRKAGINLYVGLWEGPTLLQLNDLKIAQMPVICPQNDVGLAYRDKSTIVGWMHQDEPDNAQPLPFGGGHGSPILPSEIQSEYRKMKLADPTRPVFLNLGQGAAWDGWGGRGARSGKFGDYPEYLKGCDIASFDIYPYAHDHMDVQGRLGYVARGVERLRRSSGGTKPIWNIIGVAGVNKGIRPSSEQIRAMVWMSIIHGSRGIVYFVHEWKPRFRSATMIDDQDLFERVRKVNREVLALAPVIHSPTVSHVVSVSASGDPPPAISAHKHQGDLYLFTVEMTGRPLEATWKLEGEWGKRPEVEVLSEGREVPILDGTFKVRYEGYGVKLYRVKG